jgi:hypothetical protein
MSNITSYFSLFLVIAISYFTIGTFLKKCSTHSSISYQGHFNGAKWSNKNVSETNICLNNPIPERIS